MTISKISAIVQYLKAATSDWNNLNTPVPADALIIDQETLDIKIGDGTTLFRNLPVKVNVNNILSLYETVISKADGAVVTALQTELAALMEVMSISSGTVSFLTRPKVGNKNVLLEGDVVSPAVLAGMPTMSLVGNLTNSNADAQVTTLQSLINALATTFANKASPTFTGVGTVDGTFLEKAPSALVPTSPSYSVALNAQRFSHDVALVSGQTATVVLPAVDSASVYSAIILVRQDAGGTGAVAWDATSLGGAGTTIKWNTNLAPTIATGANKHTRLWFIRDGRMNYWSAGIQWKETA